MARSSFLNRTSSIAIRFIWHERGPMPHSSGGDQAHLFVCRNLPVNLSPSNGNRLTL
jgi:hypothetical protein